jgi:ubiquinone/menaquinone biosynthesis C-methylase UbiE
MSIKLGIKAILGRPAPASGPAPASAPRPASAPGGSQPQKSAPGIDYEGAWNRYARKWAENFPGRSHIGDEWIGTESGGATSLDEYNQLLEDRFIAPYVEKSDTVLELGVGGGKTAALLRAHAGELICADIASEMLAATRERLGEDGIRYVKLDGLTLDGIEAQSVDVFFCYDTMVHIEPRDIFNYLSRVPPLMRGKRLCVLHHTNILSERGWARFLREWDKNLMGKRSGTSFSVMTDSIMERFLDHLGYEVIQKDTTTVPRDCVWIVRAPAVPPQNGS